MCVVSSYFVNAHPFTGQSLCCQPAFGFAIAAMSCTIQRPWPPEQMMPPANSDSVNSLGIHLRAIRHSGHLAAKRKGGCFYSPSAVTLLFPPAQQFWLLAGACYAILAQACFSSEA